MPVPAFRLTHPSVRLTHPSASRTCTLVATEGDMASDEFRDSFGGCTSKGPLGWQGALLAGAATYLWYLGTNTKTNREREASGQEEPGVRRRAVVLVLLLQVGAAFGKGGTQRICTREENRERTRRVLEKKGFKNID